MGALAACLIAVIGLAAARPGPAAARQTSATPTSTVPAARECTVAPRQIPPPPATPIATPAASPTPFAQPSGHPADAATVQAVTATIRESVACANAGDALRDLALFSDRYVENYLYGPAALDIALFRQMAATPQPAARGEALALVSVKNVILLSDGRAAATVVTQNTTTTYTDELILVKGSSRWLIDEFHQLSPLPATATAAPTSPPISGTAAGGGGSPGSYGSYGDYSR